MDLRSAACTGRFIPGKERRSPVKAVWAPESPWRFRKRENSFASDGMGAPLHPARSIAAMSTMQSNYYEFEYCVTKPFLQQSWSFFHITTVHSHDHTEHWMNARGPCVLCLQIIQDRGPIPLAALPKAWVCGRSLAGIAGSNPTRMSVVEWCVLSGRGAEEFFRVWCVWVWSWTLDNKEVVAHQRLLLHGRRGDEERIRLVCVSDLFRLRRLSRNYLQENTSHLCYNYQSPHWNIGNENEHLDH